jgi:hypothetical protein
MDFDIVDDLEVNEDYQELEVTFRPPTPGNYTFKPVSWEMKKDKAGNLVRYKDAQGNPKYPVFNLKMVEIVDPIDNSRQVGVFQDVPTNVFEREGHRVSQAADFLKSINGEAVAANTGEVISQISEALNAGMPFRARLDYTGYDKNYAAQLLSEAGGAQSLTKKELNALYTKAKVRGYKNIRKQNTAAGQPTLPIYKWVGPSGDVIDVRPILTIFFSANDDVTLGPDKSLL